MRKSMATFILFAGTMGQQQSAEKPENLKELAAKMDFTEEEIEAWYKQFRADNPDGTINHEKMKELYSKIFPHGDSEAFSKDIYRILDANHDNNVDFTEFMMAVFMSRKGSNEDKCRAAFKLYDKDGKGTITREEMVDVFQVSSKNSSSSAHEKSWQAQSCRFILIAWVMLTNLGIE